MDNYIWLWIILVALAPLVAAFGKHLRLPRWIRIMLAAAAIIAFIVIILSGIHA